MMAAITGLGFYRGSLVLQMQKNPAKKAQLEKEDKAVAFLRQNIIQYVLIHSKAQK
jgi:hypothetical protein